MYIETVPNRGSPPAILLRESYRDGRTVRKRTLLNLSSTLPILSGVAERFGESLPEFGRNFHAIRVEPGH